MLCPTTVHDNVCVDAEVTITPIVTVGTINTYCIDGPTIGECVGQIEPSCSFNVSQQICVQVPLTFGADAVALPIGIACGTPGVGKCSSSTACTYTIGYYKTHPEVITNLLITAGGSIVLGNSTTGLGYTVTTAAEAVAVLSFDIPSTSLPTNAVYATQYSVLYAQLLAAKLNVLNGATCTAATAAITAADTFLTNSPAEGMDGASDLQDALALYNQGNADGCADHCA